MSWFQSWWTGQAALDQPQSHHASFESKPMDIPPDGPNERLVSRRIHIMGMGSIGTFISHSLMCLPNPPPITLMLHKQEMYEEFKAKSRTIRLVNKKTEINDEQRGYDIDLMDVDRVTGYAYWKFLPDRADAPGFPATNPITDEEMLESGEIYIHSLIVTVKGPATKTALRSIKHRVNSQTTICLVQNGMGQVEELNAEVFTDPETRPTYMLGIISHGVFLTSSFIANHAGLGTVALGIVRDTDKFPLPPKSSIPSPAELSEEDRKRMYPTDKDLYSNLSSRYILRTLTRSPILACAVFPYLDLLQLQLEKLAMNAVLNPLTALLDVPNGAMLHNRHLGEVQRLLLAEISMVFRGLPEFEGVPNVRMRFSPARLETLFLGVSAKTAANSSSMREDIRKLKNTEVEYINGYVVKRGEQQGIKCVLNYMLMRLVMGKSYSQRIAEGEVMPYGVSKVQGRISPDSEKVMMDDVGMPAKDRRM